MTAKQFTRFGLLPGILLVLFGTGWQVSKSKNWQLFGEVISHVETDERVVALTFDDGPSPKQTDTILAILRDAEVPATFYFNGSQVDLFPQTVRSIWEAGHELGNHGYTHKRMILRSTSDIRDEIDRTDASFRAVGYQAPLTFRPPFGQKLVVLPHVLSQQGRINVMWSIDPMAAKGWEAQADAFISYTLEATQPGDIILLHPMYKHNVEVRKALPDIIAGLKERGYKFVTVSDLLAMR